MSSPQIVLALTCLIIWSVKISLFVEGVDECTAGLKSCPDINSICNDPDVNTNGTATCTCKTGFTGNGTFCEDINECNIDGVCSGEGYNCENTPGTFLCLCIRNYVMKNKTCVAKDDCTKLSLCRKDAECITVGGNFSCRCKSGYSGDGTNCTDINECEGSLHQCHSNATCENLPGSYECVCKIRIERGTSCQVSSYCPTPASDTQDKNKDDCKVDGDDDDDDTVIVLVSITIVLLILCLIALIIAIFCVYRMKMSK